MAPGVGGFKSPPAVLVPQGKVVEKAVLFSTWRGELCLPVLSSHTGCPKRHLSCILTPPLTPDTSAAMPPPSTLAKRPQRKNPSSWCKVPRVKTQQRASQHQTGM